MSLVSLLGKYLCQRWQKCAEYFGLLCSIPKEDPLLRMYGLNHLVVVESKTRPIPCNGYCHKDFSGSTQSSIVTKYVKNQVVHPLFFVTFSGLN